MEQFEQQNNAEKLPFTQEVADQIEEWFWDFEERFPLEKLNAINTIEEAEESEFRTVANEVYKKMHTFLINVLDTYDMPANMLIDITKRSHDISKAVGFISVISGKVRHE